jgi:hypothetical protein
MATEVKVPKTLEELIQLIDDSGKSVKWVFYAKPINFFTQRVFEMYKPIALLYVNNELKCAAHNKNGKIEAFDESDNVFNLTDEQSMLIQNAIKV